MDKSTLESKVQDNFSRREFFKVSALTIGAAGAWSMLGASSSSASATTKGTPLALAGYKYDRVETLASGKVPVVGCEATFEFAAIGDMNTDVFSGAQTWDVTEVGLHPFMLAYANEGFRDYSLLPVFPLRTFRHKSIFIRTDRGINKPEDLRGKKIATPGFPLPH